MTGPWRLTILHDNGAQSDYDFATYELCVHQLYQYVKCNWEDRGPPEDLSTDEFDAIELYFHAVDETEAYRIIETEVLNEIDKD